MGEPWVREGVTDGGLNFVACGPNAVDTLWPGTALCTALVSAACWSAPASTNIAMEKTGPMLNDEDSTTFPSCAAMARVTLDTRPPRSGPTTETTSWLSGRLVAKDARGRRARVASMLLPARAASLDPLSCSALSRGTATPEELFFCGPARAMVGCRTLVFYVLRRGGTPSTQGEKVPAARAFASLGVLWRARHRRSNTLERRLHICLQE